MKIVCLMENTMGNEQCLCEHGLSLYVEMENNIILADTGASGLFLENAEKLGIDVTKAEAVFLSHGHYDHGGGILELHKRNPKVKIIMQKSALGDYWHKNDIIEKYIGLDSEIKKLEGLVLLQEDCDVDEVFNFAKTGEGKQERIAVFTLNGKNQEDLKCWPEGNLVLKEWKENQYIQDSFGHEQYLVLEEKGKTVLISGCAHNGILNIVDEYSRRYHSYPDVIISGFHMRKKNGYTVRDYEVIKETAKELKRTGIVCYTGHCTGEEPYKLMKEIMGGQLRYLHCGDYVEIK